jgi:O-antigen/teichoic acid export membrane protein
VSQVASWSATLLAVRLLTPDAFGLATLAGLLAGYLTIWSELGLSIAILQQRIQDEHTLRKIFGLLLLVGALLFLVSLGTAPLLSALFDAPALTPLAQLVAVGFLIMPFSVIPNAQLSIQLQFRTLSVAAMISSLSSASATLLLAYSGFGAYALIGGSLVLLSARALVLNVSSPFLKFPSFDFRGLRTFMAFSGNVLATRTVWYWYSESDQFIVGKAMGPHQLGYYAVGRQLAAMPMDKMIEVLNSVSLPAYSALKEDPKRISSAYAKTIGITSLISIPIFWCIGLLADGLVRLLFGETWINSIPVVQILCAVMPIRMIGTLAASPLMALGRADYALRFVLCPAILVPLGLFVGSRWGVSGVAMGWLVSYPVALLVASVWTRHAFNLPISHIFAPVVPPAVCGSIATASGLVALHAFQPLDAHTLLELAIGATVFGFAYIAALRVLFPLRFTEAVGFAKLIAGSRSSST